jgi:hypothetical protein
MPDSLGTYKQTWDTQRTATNAAVERYFSMVLGNGVSLVVSWLPLMRLPRLRRTNGLPGYIDALSGLEFLDAKQSV